MILDIAIRLLILQFLLEKTNQEKQQYLKLYVILTKKLKPYQIVPTNFMEIKCLQ